MLVWNLRGVNPGFAGGSIQQVRGIRLVAGLNEKGLFDYRGARPGMVALAAVGRPHARRPQEPFSSPSRARTLARPAAGIAHRDAGR